MYFINKKILSFYLLTAVFKVFYNRTLSVSIHIAHCWPKYCTTFYCSQLNIAALIHQHLNCFYKTVNAIFSASLITEIWVLETALFILKYFKYNNAYNVQCKHTQMAISCSKVESCTPTVVFMVNIKSSI